MQNPANQEAGRPTDLHSRENRCRRSCDFLSCFHHVRLRAVIGVIAAKNGELANLSPILREESPRGRKDHQSGSCRAACQLYSSSHVTPYFSETLA
jgi:hypothetical protein